MLWGNQQGWGGPQQWEEQSWAEPAPVQPPAAHWSQLPSEDGLFIGATEVQWAKLQQEGATSLRAMLQRISTAVPLKLGVEGVPTDTPVVLKRTLFSWCRDVGRQVHIYIEDAVAAGYIIEGGVPPNEFVFCAPRPSSTPSHPQMNTAGWPALGEYRAEGQSEETPYSGMGQLSRGGGYAGGYNGYGEFQHSAFHAARGRGLQLSHQQPRPLQQPLAATGGSMDELGMRGLVNEVRDFGIGGNDGAGRGAGYGSYVRLGQPQGSLERGDRGNWNGGANQPNGPSALWAGNGGAGDWQGSGVVAKWGADARDPPPPPAPPSTVGMSRLGAALAPMRSGRSQMGMGGMGSLGAEHQGGQLHAMLQSTQSANSHQQAAPSEASIHESSCEEDQVLYDSMSAEISRALLSGFLDDGEAVAHEDTAASNSAGGWASIVKKAPKAAPAKPAATAAAAVANKAAASVKADGEEPADRVGFKVFNINGDSVVRLFQTNIVTVRANGDVCLSSGGWRTYQTFKGINAALRSLAPTLAIVADGPIHDNKWRVISQGSSGIPGMSTTFYDGMTVPAGSAGSLATATQRKMHREPAVEPAPVGGTVPPSDYICKICKVPGHWIQNCPKAPDTPKPPPAGYVCKICKVPGHWIQSCPHVSSENAAAAAAVQTVEERRIERKPRAAVPAPVAAYDQVVVEMLQELSGHDHERCVKALAASNGDVNAAAELLLSGQDPADVVPSSDHSDGWTRR